jgi:3-oxoacyl-[acyl-carrier-protein] synthase-3
MNMSMESMWTVIHRTGNVSSASAGVAWKDAIDQKRLKKDDLITLVTFGAGVTSGAALLRCMR